MYSKCYPRIFLAGLSTIAVSLVTLPAAGQSAPTDVTTSNNTGVRPYETYGGVRENINLATGNLNIVIPLLRLPGRGGHDLVVTSHQDSKIWVLRQRWNEITQDWYLWWETEGSGGLFPWLSGFYALLPDARFRCQMNFVLTMPDGTKYSFPDAKGGCQHNTSSGWVPDPGSNTAGDSNDASFLRLDTTTGSNYTVTMKNGTKIYFDSVNFTPLKEVDANGNAITFNFNGGGGFTGWTDTLGRVITYTIDSQGVHFSYRDSSGAQRTINSGSSGTPSQNPPTFSQPPNVPVHCPSTPCGTGGVGSGFITLPNGLSYTFQYNNYGELTQITYPTGGYTKYDYAAFQHQEDSGALADFREVTAKHECRNPTGGCTTAQEDTTTYTPTINGTLRNNSQNVVLDPLGNQTIVEFQQAYKSSPRETRRRTYQLTTTLLRTVEIAYTPWVDGCGDDNILPIRKTTTLDDGQVSRIEWDYDTYTRPPSSSWLCLIDNVVAQREYAYGSGAPGPLARKTTTSWLKTNPVNLQNYFSNAIHILDLKASEQVFDPAISLTAPVAQTQFEYDNYTEGLTASGAAPAQHDPSFGTSYFTRGNKTATQRWRNTDGSWLTTRNQYDDAGNVVKTTDPLNHATSFSYTDSWNAQPGGNACAPTGGNAAAYVTGTTNALNQTTSSKYNSCIGTRASTTDPNNQATTFSFDLMDRVVQTNLPDGGQTTLAYNEGALPLNLTATMKIDGTKNLVSTSVVDGLSRVVQMQLNSDPDGVTYTDTTYDGLGHKSTVSNPHRTASSPTDGITNYQYDGLGRVTRVIPPDGTTTANNVTTTYFGNATTATDQAGKQRRSFTDALGRLIEVDEPAAGSGSPTAGTGSVTIGGVEQSLVPCFGCATIYDSGTVSVTVNGIPESVTYGQSSNAASVASALATAFTNDTNSPVTASVNGNVINFTSRTTGSATNYQVTVNSSTSDPGHFGRPSFIPYTAGALSCGAAASGSPSLCTPAQTLYTYDVLNNPTCMEQHGAVVGTGCASPPSSDATSLWRVRRFTYNSLSQLTRASNPESGTINYTYDNDGNLLTKQDARNTTTTYAYDPLHRLIGKTYSDTTPAVNFGYDGIAPAGCTLPTLTINNGIGKRTGMCDAAGAESWSHDITSGVGWKITDARTTNNVTKMTVVQNNLAGSVASLTYPSGRAITYAYNAAARPLSAVDTANSINYALNATYAPQGALSSLVLGQTATFTGINLNLGFNNRLQPATIRAWSTSATPLDLSYCFYALVNGVCPTTGQSSNNGNVTAITNNRDTTRSQSFTYDALNRMATAQTSATTGLNCWGETFGYDIWGNLLSIGGVTGYTGCTQQSLSVTALANNQLSSYGYDAAGNMTNYPSLGTYTYNAENQLTSTAGVTYTYDGDGKRVQKSSGKLYWYGMGTDPLAESDTTGNITDEYIFSGGKRIARRHVNPAPPDAISYYFADHLGTSRVVTDAPGNVLDDSDFYPFGGERPVLSSSGNNYKFTSKERDAESGLDYFGARYYSSAFGRFTSTDPKSFSARTLVNPQKWNKYAYVLNNPLALVDPNGLEEVTVTFRAFIPQEKVGGFGGDNRTFSADPNASSRTSITVRVETDQAKRGSSNPIIGTPEVKVGATYPTFTSGFKPATGPSLPTATAIYDENGNTVITIKQDVKNPYVLTTRGIRADVAATIPQDASSVEYKGNISGSPSFEANTQVDGGQVQNLPLQTASSNTLVFIINLQMTNQIDKKEELKKVAVVPPPHKE